MARGKRNEVTQEESDPRQTTIEGSGLEDVTVDVTDEPAAPAPTHDELRALFAAVRDHDGQVEAAEHELEIRKAYRSAAIKAIVEAVGNKGPWTVDGETISVSARGDSYTFRRQRVARLTL